MAETQTVQQDAVTVHWQDASGASTAGGPMGGLPFIFLMIGVFYFVLIRPQQKEQKKHQGLLSALVKGQQVVTSSGLHGRVYTVNEKDVVLEVADKVRVIVDKVSIKRRLGED